MMIKYIFLIVLLPSLCTAQLIDFTSDPPKPTTTTSLPYDRKEIIELPTILACEKEKILFRDTIPQTENVIKELNETVKYVTPERVSYKYVSGEVVPAQEYKGLKEDMKKRTINSQHFMNGNTTISKCIAGQQFFKDKNTWYQIAWADMEPEAYKEQTKKSLVARIKDYFKQDEAQAVGIAGRSYRPEADDVVWLTPSSVTQDNYEMVDEVISDSGDTNVYPPADKTTYTYDLYEIPDHDVSLDDYTITNVVQYGAGFGCGDVYCTGNGGSMQLILDDSSHSPYSGQEFDLDKLFTLNSYDYGSTNPLTTVAWTWDDIDDLKIGWGLKEKVATDFYVYGDQLYIIVKSTAEFDVGAGDGRIQYALTDVDSWDTVHDAPGGAANAAIETAAVGSTFRIDIGPPVNLHYSIIKRGFFPIDTSSIPSGDTVSAADFVFFASAGTNMRLVQTSQADETTLASGDFDECGAVDNPTAGATDFLLDGYAWNTITLNATGISWIKKDGEAPNCGGTNGWTCLGLRERTWDAEDLEAEHSAQSFVGTSESGFPPYLVVVHSSATTTTPPSRRIMLY